MFLELSPEEKLKYLLRQEWGLHLLNKKIQELLAAYQKNKSSKALLALTTAMGQVNDICANVIDQNKDNIVPMKENGEEEKLKKGSDPGLQLLNQEPEAVSKRYISNLAVIEAMPNQERNPAKKKLLKKLVKQLLAKGPGSKRSRVSPIPSGSQSVASPRKGVLGILCKR